VDPRILAAVVFAGPAGAGTALATLAVALGLGAAGATALGLCGIPVGLAATHWWFEERGRAGLRRALEQHARAPESARDPLLRLARSSACLPEVRLEAAARLALEAFERGEVEAAVEHLEIHEQDRSAARRRRSWAAGLRGEVLRSIFAWLFPDRFVDAGVARSAALMEHPEVDPPDPEALALVGALRVLEAAAAADRTTLAAAWEDLRGTGVATELPTLHAVAAAAAARELPEALEELQRWRADEPGSVRMRLVRRLFPALAVPEDEAYRGVSVDPIAVAADEPAVEVPAEIRALATYAAADAAPISRWPLAGALAGTYGVFALLAAAAGGSAIAIAVSAIVGLYLGSPIAFIVAGGRIAERERARRVAPLGALRPRPPRVWLVECASGPPGAVVQSTAFRRLPDLPASQMALFVAAARAEHAISIGDLDGALAHLDWWLAGFSGRLPPPEPMYAVGATLVRVSALAGRAAAAEELARVVPEQGFPWDDASRRTCRGNAPRALALARSLLTAHQGRWSEAAELLHVAAAARRVWLSPHDEALYGELARRVAAQGHRVPRIVRRTRPELAGWVARVWPEPPRR
jgi:hypothetical protein